LGLAVIAVLLAVAFAFVPLMGNPERIRQLVEDAGAWGPVAFVAIQALQVIAAPVPGQVTGLASGYLFGPVLGTIFCVIGGTLGCTIVFVLSRRFGRPFVETFVSQRALQRFDFLAGTAGPLVLLVIFIVPIFPDDVISYIAGLTRIRIRTLVLIALFGRLPGYIIYAIAGERAAAADTTALVIIAVATVVLLPIFYWQRHRIEALVRRLAEKKNTKDAGVEPAA
jgi:uncharacterized membrane protein YdjX (TVP38/TMEM64 family)